MAAGLIVAVVVAIIAAACGDSEGGRNGEDEGMDAGGEDGQGGSDTVRIDSTGYDHGLVDTRDVVEPPPDADAEGPRDVLQDETPRDAFISDADIIAAETVVADVIEDTGKDVRDFFTDIAEIIADTDAYDPQDTAIDTPQDTAQDAPKIDSYDAGTEAGPDADATDTGLDAGDLAPDTYHPLDLSIRDADTNDAGDVVDSADSHDAGDEVGPDTAPDSSPDVSPDISPDVPQLPRCTLTAGGVIFDNEPITNACFEPDIDGISHGYTVYTCTDDRRDYLIGGEDCTEREKCIDAGCVENCDLLHATSFDLYLRGYNGASVMSASALSARLINPGAQTTFNISLDRVAVEEESPDQDGIRMCNDQSQSLVEDIPDIMCIDTAVYQFTVAGMSTWVFYNMTGDESSSSAVSLFAVNVDGVLAARMSDEASTWFFNEYSCW